MCRSSKRDEMKKFGYENLNLWDRAVDFSVKVIELVDTFEFHSYML